MDFNVVHNLPANENIIQFSLAGLNWAFDAVNLKSQMNISKIFASHRIQLSG